MDCFTFPLIIVLLSKVTGKEELQDFMAITVATEKNEKLQTFLNSSTKTDNTVKMLNLMQKMSKQKAEREKIKKAEYNTSCNEKSLSINELVNKDFPDAMNKEWYTEMKKILYKAHSEGCSGSPLQFLDPPGPITGLWSYPGSGNTWIRYLIEQATGKITGSVYKHNYVFGDLPHFIGGTIANGSVIVVKDHHLNPLECFLSEVNRNFITPFEYFKYAPIEAFDHYKNLDDLFFIHMFPLWKLFHQRILTRFKKPLLVVEYHRLKSNLIKELAKIVEFLNHEMTEDIIRCIHEGKVGPFKRPKRPKHEFDELMKKIKKDHVDAYNEGYEIMVNKLQSRFQ